MGDPFSPSDYLFGKEPNAFLKSQAHRLRKGQTAFSVADGEGRNGVWLAEQGLDVLTVDFSETALAKAQALARERGVRTEYMLNEATTEKKKKKKNCARIFLVDPRASGFGLRTSSG